MKFEDMLNKITLGDSYMLIKNIPDNSIDLIIIDPPYKFTGGGKMTGLFKDRGVRYFDAIEGKGLDNNYDLKILDELMRVLKKINIYIWCNKEQLYQYFDYFEDKNCLFEVLIWNKTNPIPLVNNQYITDKEYCLYFRERGYKIKGTYETKKTIYISPANVEDKKKYKHPTIKTINIIKNLIINSSNKEDIVLDCFSGSGTTCVAAKELERQFIGIEIDPEYHRISVDRLNGVLANGQISVFTDINKL